MEQQSEAITVQEKDNSNHTIKHAIRDHMLGLLASMGTEQETPIDSAFIIAASNFSTEFEIAFQDRAETEEKFLNYLRKDWWNTWAAQPEYTEQVKSSLSCFCKYSDDKAYAVGLALDQTTVLAIDGCNFTIFDAFEEKRKSLYFTNPASTELREAQRQQQKEEEENRRLRAERLRNSEKERLEKQKQKQKQLEERELNKGAYASYTAACQARKARIAVAKEVWRTAVSKKLTVLAELEIEVIEARRIAKEAENEEMPRFEDFKVTTND